LKDLGELLEEIVCPAAHSHCRGWLQNLEEIEPRTLRKSTKSLKIWVSSWRKLFAQQQIVIARGGSGTLRKSTPELEEIDKILEESG
jgi:hypothetical protein